MDPPLSSSSLSFPHRYLNNASSSVLLHDDQDFTIPKFLKNVGAYLCLGFSASVCIGLARQPPLFASCTVLAFALCVNSHIFAICDCTLGCAKGGIYNSEMSDAAKFDQDYLAICYNSCMENIRIVLTAYN
ncbi:hypothetical protein TorRG33x02_141720 [Trema orientale]|uniref:Uncharacterized protein n=1 Tax=Trema orientale TaxID=63057 RepID=A0A2P5EX78_TREOI|nr:hypothetical protein TorRG33x02_141720 [Trema orientale]